MTSSIRLMRRALLAALIVCLFGMMAFAQSTTDGAIGGTVYDSTGAVVGGAKVVVHNNGTNAETTITADPSGYYPVPRLPPGTYTVTISGGSRPRRAKAPTPSTAPWRISHGPPPLENR